MPSGFLSLLNFWSLSSLMMTVAKSAEFRALIKPAVSRMSSRLRLELAFFATGYFGLPIGGLESDWLDSNKNSRCGSF